MKIVTVFIVIGILALLGIWMCLIRYKMSFDKDWINVLCNLLVAICTLILAFFTYQSVMVSKEMAIQVQQANQINYRAYIVIRPVPIGQAQMLAEKDQRNLGLSEKIKAEGYTFIKAPNGDFLQYNIANIGVVPAYNIKDVVEVYETNEKTGVEKIIPINNTSHTIGEVLLPKQDSTKMMSLGFGTIFRDDFVDKSIRVKLKVTFNGVKDIDPNKYFYTIQWRIKPAQSPEELNKQSSLDVELTDEGKE